MRCERQQELFDVWLLDVEHPPAHLTECAMCRADWQTWNKLKSALGQPPNFASSGFVTEAMRRIESNSTASPLAATDFVQAAMLRLRDAQDETRTDADSRHGNDAVSVVKRAQKRWFLLGLSAAAGIIVALFASSALRQHDSDAGFQVRGAQKSEFKSSGIRVYRATGEIGYERVEGSLAKDDRLVFEYLNPRQSPYRYLMIFAIGPDAKIFWYHPEFKDSQPAQSISIARTDEAQGIMIEVQHALVPGWHRFYGVFSTEPLATDIVAAAIERAETTDPTRLKTLELRDVHQHSFLLQVSP